LASSTLQLFMHIIRFVLIALYQPYKWLFYFPFLFINTLIFGIIAVLFSILFGPRIGSYWGGAVWSKINSWLVPMFVKVSGRENIDEATSYIVLTNHQSAYDIFLVYGWLGIDIKWIMKKELRKVPGLGFGSAKVGHIFLDRSNSRAALRSLEEAKKKLVNGTSVVVFPEGTRSKTGAPGPFKRGAFKLALDLGLPILPVTLIDTKKILPADSINILPGRVQMVIHPPIEITGYNENNMNELIEKVRNQICSPL
jgi:1-acyl-sn-glycerol-3-phosphate acyltransferase